MARSLLKFNLHPYEDSPMFTSIKISDRDALLNARSYQEHGIARSTAYYDLQGAGFKMGKSRWARLWDQAKHEPLNNLPKRKEQTK